MALEGGTGTLRVVEIGPEYREEDRGECVELHLGHRPDNFSPTAWSRLPSEVKEFIADRAKTAQQSVATQWDWVSNEEAMTGALFGQIATSRRIAGWSVDIKYIEFSKQSKEPGTGADLAVILEVMDSTGMRAYKSLWLQAKRAERAPQRYEDLARVEGQVKAMQAFTHEAYIAVYTRTGVKVAKPSAQQSWRSLDSLLLDAMNCTAGDPSSTLLGDSMNRQHLLSVQIEKMKR